MMAEMMAERKEGLHRLEQLHARNLREHQEFWEEFNRDWEKIDQRRPYDPELVPAEE